MEIYISHFFLFLIFAFSSLWFLFSNKQKNRNLPPGSSGWPFVGETLEFLSTGRKGHPEKFVFDRIFKYSSQIFRTHLIGSPFIVFCGANGNKFVFSNEDKLVQNWWPSSIGKILPSSEPTTSKEGSMFFKNVLPIFLKPEGLQRYIGIMDTIIQQHLDTEWENKEDIVVFPLVKHFAFLIACRLFMSIEDQNLVAKFEDQFSVLYAGFKSVPVDFPATPFNKAIKASKIVKKGIITIIKQRKMDLGEGKASPPQDILSHMLLTSDENGKFLHELDIANYIVGLLIGGHDTTSSVCASIINYLAELPHIYEQVYKEQMEIAKNKSPGELLNWDDLRNMKYSWNVAREAMRIAPPFQGGFREAMTDFAYNGFSVPKGWKIYWSVNSTHKNPEFFSEPHKFDPSRFHGSGPAPYTYVPFGGGVSMCPGKEYARMEILVFMHHLVRRFKWEKLILDEKFVVNAVLYPEKGLPIRLFRANT